MKRAAFIGWSAASVAVWLVVAFAITRFTYAHTYFEIPMWFREAITSLWLRFEPDYNPDALDMKMPPHSSCSSRRIWFLRSSSCHSACSGGGGYVDRFASAPPPAHRHTRYSTTFTIGCPVSAR